MIKSIHQSVLLVLLFAFGLSDVYAQETQNIEDGFRLGASVNYGGIYYESNSDLLNDIWSSSLGYQFHALYGYRISSLFSLNTGATLFINRYSFDEQRTPATNEQGEPTGNFIRSSMTGSVVTSYIGLPVNFIIRPLGNKSLYALVGPEVSYKVAHSNGTIKTVFETESEEENEELFEEVYDIPERSKNTLLFVNLGIGYSFDANFIPLNIEIGAKQALTPYMSGDNFITSWIRNFSLTASYHF